jgi:FtsP/CotA-like multicopper oxidase with cupredoxin domain
LRWYQITLTYPNQQDATLLWYHDHALGITRLNVYAGLAGGYILRDAGELGLIGEGKLPSGPYEVPLVIQDRMFYGDGRLAYPDVPPQDLTAFPAGAVSIHPEFFGTSAVGAGAAGSRTVQVNGPTGRRCGSAARVPRGAPFGDAHAASGACGGRSQAPPAA